MLFRAWATPCDPQTPLAALTTRGRCPIGGTDGGCFGCARIRASLPEPDLRGRRSTWFLTIYNPLPALFSLFLSMATTGMVPPGGPGGGGDDDDDGPPPPKRSRANKPCRCGATNHQRVSSKLCPLNPANGAGQQRPQGQQQEIQLPALENDDSDSDSDEEMPQAPPAPVAGPPPAPILPAAPAGAPLPVPALFGVPGLSVLMDALSFLTYTRCDPFCVSCTCQSSDRAASSAASSARSSSSSARCPRCASRCAARCSRQPRPLPAVQPHDLLQRDALVCSP